MQEHPEDQFDAAPSCRAVPTATTSTPDSIGRLWGWHHETSCAFKDVAGHVLFYTEYTPASWLRTPACAAAPFPDDSVADAKFKVKPTDILPSRPGRKRAATLLRAAGTAV